MAFYSSVCALRRSVPYLFLKAFSQNISVDAGVDKLNSLEFVTIFADGVQLCCEQKHSLFYLICQSSQAPYPLTLNNLFDKCQNVTNTENLFSLPKPFFKY